MSVGNLMIDLGLDRTLDSIRDTMVALLRSPSTAPELIASQLANLKAIHVIGRYDLIRRGAATEIPCSSCGKPIEFRMVVTTLLWTCRARGCPWEGVEHQVTGMLSAGSV